MCVIAIKPKDVDVPSRDAMLEMFDYNSDGAGFAYALNKRVYIEKGFMTFADFYKAVQNLEVTLSAKYSKSLKDISMMFHFRIGTHGPNSPALTHPFPISFKKEHLEALDLYTDVVMAHNGVIQSITPNTGWSDTTQYIKDILFPLYRLDKKFYTQEPIQELINNTINSSRFAFLDKNGDFTLLGKWEESKDKALAGIKFSNLNHEGYGYYYGGRWGSSSRYDFSFYKEEKLAEVKKLPKGTILLTPKNLDKDFNVIPETSLRIYGEGEHISFYVDEKGDIYYGYADSMFVSSSSLYDFAIMEKDLDTVYGYLTSKSPELADIPFEKKYTEYNGYKY